MKAHSEVCRVVGLLLQKLATYNKLHLEGFLISLLVADERSCKKSTVRGSGTLHPRFNGREIVTGSCLAFAPRNKTGRNNQATQQDWQAATEDDFVKLEPWAVPCGAEWLKNKWDKWQGYSFYTVGTSIEACLTVTFSLSMQPVVAFVGGVTFNLLPGPLAEIDTQVRASCILGLLDRRPNLWERVSCYIRSEQRYYL